jgi:hypothetical protein
MREGLGKAPLEDPRRAMDELLGNAVRSPTSRLLLKVWKWP